MNEPTVEMTMTEMLEIAAEYQRHPNVQLALNVQDGLKKLKFITNALEMRKASQQPQQDELGQPMQQRPQQRRQMSPAPRPAQRQSQPIPAPEQTGDEGGFIEGSEME